MDYVLQVLCDRWTRFIKQYILWAILTSLFRERVPLLCFQLFWQIIFYSDISCGICSVFLWLNIEEVLASIKELFSCHKDDGSAYNDKADVLQWNICRPYLAAFGRKSVLPFFFSNIPSRVFFSFLILWTD